MTEEAPEDIFAELNVTKILVAILESHKELMVPTSVLIEALNEDKELQVDYDADNQTFVFKLKVKDDNVEH
jgi:hypothetical protein